MESVANSGKCVKSRHGWSRTKLYRRWKHMHARCRDAKRSRYFGRGIRVCDEWAKFEPFRDWAIENGFREDLTIERKDNCGNYSPDNCCWANASQQARNRASNRALTAFGEAKLMCEWAEDPRCKVSLQTFKRRIRKGWETERAISENPRKWVRRG